MRHRYIVWYSYQSSNGQGNGVTNYSRGKEISSTEDLKIISDKISTEVKVENVFITNYKYTGGLKCMQKKQKSL